MSRLIIFLVLASICHGLPLKKRIEYLEMQVNRLSLQTKNDIYELRDLIENLNTTMGGETPIGPSAAGASSEEMQALVLKMEEFIGDQEEGMSVLHTAFADEKLRNIENMKKKQAGVENGGQVSEEVMESIDLLNNRIDIVDFERNMTSGEMSSRISDLTTVVEELTTRLQKLEEAGPPVVQPPVRPSPGFPGPPCPPGGWVQWKDKCFLFMSNESVMWEVANMRCHQFDGILAEPDTEEAMNYLFTLVGKGSSHNAWIGATDEITDGTWIWIDSKREVQWFNWESGQPNNYGGKQDCMEIYKGHLNDEKCAADNKYICQKNAN